MTEGSPVSVVIPTHDRADALPRAIDSVLRQTFSRFELIVIDDASCDRTPEVLAEYGDERLRVARFDARRGANAARNRGVELARGEYVSFLDSDDELHPEHLDRVVRTFAELPEHCACVFTACELVSERGDVRLAPLSGGPATYDDVLSGAFVGGFSCATFRASVFEEVGALDEKLRACQDYDYFIRMLKRGFTVHRVTRPLVTCHHGDGRISDAPGRKVQGGRGILAKHGADLSPGALSRLHYYIAFGHARAGELRRARRQFRRALEYDPTRWLAYPHLLAACHPTVFDLLLSLKEFIAVRLVDPIRRLRRDADDVPA